MTDLFQKINSRKISFEYVESELIKFKSKLDLLNSIITRKRRYTDKNNIVYKNAKSLFEGLKLIYKGFVDGIFGEHLMVDRSGDEKKYSKIYDNEDDEFYIPKEVTPRDKIFDPELRRMFEDEEIPIDMPDLEREESARKGQNQPGEGLKILTPE